MKSKFGWIRARLTSFPLTFPVETFLLRPQPVRALWETDVTNGRFLLAEFRIKATGLANFFVRFKISMSADEKYYMCFAFAWKIFIDPSNSEPTLSNRTTMLLLARTWRNWLRINDKEKFISMSIYSSLYLTFQRNNKCFCSCIILSPSIKLYHSRLNY